MVLTLGTINIIMILISYIFFILGTVCCLICDILTVRNNTFNYNSHSIFFLLQQKAEKSFIVHKFPYFRTLHIPYVLPGLIKDAGNFGNNCLGLILAFLLHLHPNFTPLTKPKEDIWKYKEKNCLMILLSI